VSWNAVSGALSYNIYYGTTAGVTKTNGSKMVNAATPQAITVLTNGTPYYFAVTAVNADGESVLSNEVTATPLPPAPAKPAGIGATGGDGQVTVTWSAVTGASSYNIYYGTATGVTATTGIKLANATTPRVVTSLTNGTTYYFVVTAVNTGGKSIQSSEKSATPSAVPQIPSSPNGRVVTSTVTGELAVTWNVVLDATSYRVYYLQASSQPANAAVLASTFVTSTTNSATVTGLASGTYYVLITAVNAVGESGTQSNAGSGTTVQ
jgi:fibronectin type 3 domain-containing protein